jgi:hypothetical protein
MIHITEIELTQRELHAEIRNWQRTQQFLLATHAHLISQEMGERLEHSAATIYCYARPENLEAAVTYRQIIGRTETNFVVIVTDDPVANARKETTAGIIPLVINSAIDLELKEMMFQNPHFGQLLTDRFPVPNAENPNLGPILYCVGVTTHGIEVLSQANISSEMTMGEDLENKRSKRIKNTVGEIITPADVHQILHSEKVKKIVIHVLGPVGTNIDQAAHLYVERLGIGNKAEIITYGSGVTPMDYSKIASDQTRNDLLSGSSPEVLHLHVECAVYYNMGTLYRERVGESVFTDEQDMALDTMQLAAREDIKDLNEILQKNGKIKLATHTSPQSLALPWIQTGQVEVIKASSNSAAALMVASGEADACITTASAVELSNGAVKTLHEFGSPNMIFTIGSPLSHDQLKQYLVETE